MKERKSILITGDSPSKLIRARKPDRGYKCPACGGEAWIFHSKEWRCKEGDLVAAGTPQQFYALTCNARGTVMASKPFLAIRERPTKDHGKKDGRKA